MGGHQKLSDAQMRAAHMSGALQGQMGLKSSVLSPTSSKLSKQHMVLAHMNTHYRKIVKAKSAIDMSPPKSMTQSQKARDRTQREWIQKGGEPRSKSQMSNASEWSDEELYDPVNWGPSDDEDDAKIRDIMKATLHPHKNHSVEAAYGSENPSQQARMESYQKPNHWTNQNNSSDPMTMTMNNTMRPSSARSQRSQATSRSMSRTMTQKSTEGDVLEMNSHKFTEAEKPFTPRILKSNKVVSRLSQSRCYTAPKKAAPKSLKAKPAENSSSKNEAGQRNPVPQPRRNSSPPPRNDTPLSESTLMFESLQSRDFQRLKQKHTVPTLDITVDEDHNQWLQEQASKAKLRAKSGRQTAGQRTMSQIEERDEMLRNSPRTLGSTRGDKMAGQTLKRSQAVMVNNQNPLARTRTSARSFGGAPLSNRRLNEEEEELKYLDFVRDVTNDILDRGIFTNRVLKQVFENHIQRRKGELSEAKMRMKLDSVRRELGIPPDFEATQEDETGYSTSRSHRSKTGHKRDTLDYTDHPTEVLNDTVFTDVTDKMDGTRDTFRLSTGEDLTMTGLEDTNQFGETLEMTGVDTLGFQSTGNVYSTIRSVPDNDLSVTQDLESFTLETTMVEEKETVTTTVEEVPHPKPSPRKTVADPLPKPRERRTGSKHTTQDGENLSKTMSLDNRPKMQRQKAQENEDDDDDIMVQSNPSPREPKNVEEAIDEAIVENYEDDYEDDYESEGENKDDKGGNPSDDDF